MKLCGYCEYGYRLFMTDCGKVYRLPIPYVFTEYRVGHFNKSYWW